ncbi:MAG: Lrp/AsnC family transcriptional regulator [Promethearchaeota archaeon]
MLLYELDEIDQQIIGWLGRDARISLSEIGRKLNLSHVAIRNRLVNLSKKNIIKTGVLVNILELNLEVVYLLIQTDGAASTRELINRFKNCPRIIQMSTVLGQFDLITTVFAEDKKQLETILRTCILRAPQGIRNVSVLSVGRLINPPYFPVNFKLKHNDLTPCGLNCADCEEYELEHCLGCPATSAYKGSLDFCLEEESEDPR